MFRSIEYLLRIMSYFIMVFFIYQTLQISQKRHERDPWRPRVSHLYIITVSLLFALWAVSNFHGGEGDHYNYAFRFENIDDGTIQLQSYGLALIYDFLHNFTTNSNIMFITVIFLGNYLTFWAYRIHSNATPHTMLFLLLSEYFLYNFVAIKQFVAVGFAFLFFAHFFSGRRIFCIVWIPLAIMFHEMSYMLIPIYFVLWFQNNRAIRLGALGVIVLVFLLPAVFYRIMPAIANLIPALGTQLEEHLGSGVAGSANFATVLKGAPYYLFALMPLFHKSTFTSTDKNYYGGRFLVYICSVFVLASFFNYWYFRFSYLMMLPVFAHIDNVVKDADAKDVILLRHVAILVLVGLTVKYLFQTYFLYGGI